MTTMVRNRRPPRPTAQGPVYPDGETPPDDSIRRAESGADDREGRLATLGKEQEDQEVLLTIQEICQSTSSVLAENAAKESHDWPIGGSTILVRPTPPEALNGQDPIDAVILIEAVWPWSKSPTQKPLRAGLRVPVGTLGAVLKALFPWIRRISRQGWGLRTLILFAPHVGVRSPATPDDEPTPPITEPQRTLTALIYQEVETRHVNWVRTNMRHVDPADRLDRLNAVCVKALDGLCAGRINLERFRLQLEFAHRRVTDEYRRDKRHSRRLEHRRQDVGRELGWGDTPDTLAEDPGTGLQMQETEASERRMQAALLDLLDKFAKTGGTTQRETAEYLRKCLVDGAEPTGAGLARHRGVDASVGWRQLHQLRQTLQTKLIELDDASLRVWRVGR